MLTIEDILQAGAPPVVAILRGIRPPEAVAVTAALVEAGIRMIEVPLNSPDPFASIASMQAEFGEVALIGAGTVLDPGSVTKLAATGARLLVTPNVDSAVIGKGIGLGLEVMPGCLTPTEAFAAFGAGARRLKLFPSGVLGTGYLKAVLDVVPRHFGIWAVGGVDAGNARDWLCAGAQGIGVGGSIYRPGDTAQIVSEKAAALLAAIDGRA